MSKRELKKMLNDSDLASMQEQLILLYEKFPQVKEYYDFIFNPNEENRVEEAKKKIKEEYYPQKRKRARQRRSVAQKLIKHYMNLGVESSNILDLMLFNLDIQFKYAAQHKVSEITYPKSVYNSFKQAIDWMIRENLQVNNEQKIEGYVQKAAKLGWYNLYNFESDLERLQSN